MNDDDIRWAEAALAWARGTAPRDSYDVGVFARLNAGIEAGRVRDACAACGNPPAEADPLVLADGWRIHLHHVRDENDGFYGIPFQALAAA
jgi:hypothetical protein